MKHKTLIVMEISIANEDVAEPCATSSRKVVYTKSEFLKLAKEWWDARGTHFNDFDDFHALAQPESK